MTRLVTCLWVACTTRRKCAMEQKARRDSVIHAVIAFASQEGFWPNGVHLAEHPAPALQFTTARNSGSVLLGRQCGWVWERCVSGALLSERQGASHVRSVEEGPAARIGDSFLHAA
jgi:hypothetical protein